MFWSIILQLAACQYISLSDEQNNQWIIYDATGGYQSQFNWPYPDCCTPPTLTIINATNSTNYQNQVLIQLTNYSVVDYNPQVKTRGYTIEAEALGNTDSQFFIQNSCPTQSDYIQSGMVEFQFIVQDAITNKKSTLKFAYWFECQFGDRVKINYDWSMTFLIIMACFFVAIFTKLSKIRSIKIRIPNPAKDPSLIRWIASQAFQTEEQEVYFQGFRVNWIFFILYILATVLFYLIVHEFQNSWKVIFMVLCCLLALFSGYFFLNEIQCYFSANFKLQTRILGSIRVCDIISMFLIILITTFYLIFNQPWYLSCLMAFCITGTLARLFKVTNLRGITLLYGLIILFDCIYYFIGLTLVEINYQTTVLMYSNSPVLFELPQFRFNVDKICSWLSVLDLLVPGLSIAYLYRFDQNRNSKVYFIIGLLGLFFGILLWLITMLSVQKEVQIPQSIFVLPLIVSFTSLWALKQGDFRIIWFGQFYDKYLMEDFIQRYQDETTENELNNSRLNDEQISDLIQGLNLGSQL